MSLLSRVRLCRSKEQFTIIDSRFTWHLNSSVQGDGTPHLVLQEAVFWGEEKEGSHQGRHSSRPGRNFSTTIHSTQKAESATLKHCANSCQICQIVWFWTPPPQILKYLNIKGTIGELGCVIKYAKNLYPSLPWCKQKQDPPYPPRTDKRPHDRSYWESRSL